MTAWVVNGLALVGAVALILVVWVVASAVLEVRAARATERVKPRAVDPLDEEPCDRWDPKCERCRARWEFSRRVAAHLRARARP